MTKKPILFAMVWMFVQLLNAQTIMNPGFMRQTVPYEFNLPQFGVGVSLPADAGFTVPVFSGGEVMLDIGDKVTYCFGLSYLESSKTNFFRFALSGNDKEYLQLSIVPVIKTDRVYLSEIARHRRGFIRILKSMKTDLGESVSYLSEKDGRTSDIHIFGHDGYLFIFSIYSDIANKQEYEKLINRFKKKTLLQEKIKYETRVESGYYDKERGKITNFEKEKFTKIAGKLNQNAVVHIPSECMSITIPQNWVYELNGRGLKDNDGQMTLELDELDMLDNSLLFSWFRGEEMSVIARYSYKKSRSASNFDNLASGAKQVYTHFTDTKVIIDGIEAGATFYGAPELGSLELWFETETGYYSFSLSNITIDNISVYDRILSSIKIESKLPRKMRTETPLSSAISMAQKGPVKLDKLDFSSAVPLKAFKCRLSTLGATLFFPGTATDYKYGINKTFGEEHLTLDSGSGISVAPDYENVFVWIYNSKQNYKINYTLYLTYDSKLTIEDMVKDWVVSLKYQSYAAKVYKAGTIKANDRSEWGVILQDEGRSAWVFGRNNDYWIYINITTSTLEEMEKICSLVYKFSFDDIRK